MLLLVLSAPAQKRNNSEIKEVNGFKFTPVAELKATSVKDQANTGTCWSFATTSFIESELLRMGKGEYDLSEMWIVRHNYIDKLRDNFNKAGKGNLGQGSLSHDWMLEYTENGIVPDEVYTGLNYSQSAHNHSELNAMINAVAKVPVQRNRESEKYLEVVEDILDNYLGDVPESFTYKGVRYTPKSFAENLGIDADDYIPITSFTHFPFYEMGLVPVPDNWREIDFYNVPVDELIGIMNNALKNGYTVAWDGDVSEKGFSHNDGIAIIPEILTKEALSATDQKKSGPASDENVMFVKPMPELKISQELRQQWFEDKSTTDDHLMHVTGLVTDQRGNNYYVTKNSWGAGSNASGGYLNMSENYVRAKTIYILVHKDAVPAEIRNKLGFQAN